MPFENTSGQSSTNWVGFGIEYLLFNKLSNITDYYVPEKAVIIKAMANTGLDNSRIDGKMVYRVGKETGINIAITGAYSMSGNQIELYISFINTFTGATIFSKKYVDNKSALFTISDEIVREMVNTTQTTLSDQEESIVTRNMTSSAKAFEYFCLGYLENEKKNARMETVTGLFRKAIREDNQFWEAYYNLGITYFNKREYDNALKQFDIITKALPNFEKPYYGRGLIYFRKKQYDLAREDFLKVVKATPNDYKPHYYLARINVKLNRIKDALSNLKKAEELNPDYAKIYFERGNIWFVQRKYQLAIPDLKKAVQLDPEDMIARQKLGESYYRIQVYYSASSEFEKILENNATDPLANFMLGITVYKQAVLSELIEAFLEIFDPATAAKQLAASGTKMEKQELYQKMAKCFYNAQAARTNFLEATFNLALTYHEMGKLDSAKIYYDKTLTIKPDLIRAHIKLAKLYEEQNQPQLALNKYKEVISIEPSYFVSHPTLGPIHHYINIVDMVMGELSDKLKANPQDLKSNVTLAKIYYAQGFYGKAANIYRKVLSINPGNSEARKMLAKLEKR